MSAVSMAMQGVRKSGKAGASDTTPGMIVPGVRTTKSRVVDDPPPGSRPALFAPGEVVVSNKESPLLQAAFQEWKAKGTVDGKKPTRTLVALLEGLQAGGSEDEGAEGYEQGGVIGLFRHLMGGNPNVERNRQEIAQMRAGTYQEPAETPSPSPQASPQAKPAARGGGVAGAFQALRGRNAQIDRTVEGYEAGTGAGGLPPKPGIGDEYAALMRKQLAASKAADDAADEASAGQSLPYKVGSAVGSVASALGNVGRAGAYVAGKLGDEIGSGFAAGSGEPAASASAPSAKAPLPAPFAVASALQAGPPAPKPLAGSAVGQVFNTDTGLETHPEERRYVQSPDGTVARADGKPMGGTFNVGGSVVDEATGNKVVQGVTGGQFTYDKNGKMLDYSSPLTDAADNAAKAAGYADRKAYLAATGGGQGGGAVSAALADMPRAKADTRAVDAALSQLTSQLNGQQLTGHGVRALAELIGTKADMQGRADNANVAAYGHAVDGASRRGVVQTLKDQAEGSLYARAAAGDPQALATWQAMNGKGQQQARRRQPVVVKQPTGKRNELGDAETQEALYDPDTGTFTSVPSAGGVDDRMRAQAEAAGLDGSKPMVGKDGGIYFLDKKTGKPHRWAGG